MEELNNVIEEIFEEDIIRLVISNKSSKEEKYNKIDIQKKEEQGKVYYQAEKFTDKQVFHENIQLDDIKTRVNEFVDGRYKQFTAWSHSKTFDVKISKKGKVHLSGKKGDNSKMSNASHNKEKNYILKEGMYIEPFIDLGIFTKEGKIVNSRYDKYKQINRFIEIIDDEVKNLDVKELNIIDFGCGKSYLTFVLYYYLVHIRKIKANITGLDLKADVIKKCNDIAKRYNYDNLHFELGDINGYKYTDKVDMVITLHACDTATDYALYNAVKWNAPMIFSVPCCQHELNGQMKSDKLSILTRYGIIQERVAALMTDSVRANLLEAAGYRTQLLEFIDISHSPKNILIRAVKSNVGKDTRRRAVQEVNNLVEEFNFAPTLLELFKKDNIIIK